ncbi:hypothetical protein ABDK00_006935 [Niabella insulamsoli]|uniref:hypothetical protein n=1 Tax=Niabella insulamsoli TaxID=3144874 RepID=UPI0031FDECCE
MNRFTDTLSEAVLTKNLEACSLDELAQMVAENPFAAALQLLYARKLKAGNDPRYPQQLQKTLLFFNNPLSVKQLIETEEAEPAAAAPLENKVEINEAEKIGAASESTHSEEVDQQAAIIPQDVANNAEVSGFFETFDDEEALDEAADDETPLPELPAFKIEAIDPAKAELAFTPYFTVDYFAAQGVKLNDQSSGDQFGRQLKSFTDWLKQMKRLPGATNASPISDKEEQSIERMAARSIHEADADTEAMAEVWAKQGNIQKAIGIYKKLSLQIPGKSAYFAAKIDYLKK